MSGGVLTRAPRACVLLFSGSLFCCGSRLRRIVSMCEFKLEIMSVEVWKKKKAAGGAIGYNALVVGFIFLFHLPAPRLLLVSALSVASVCGFFVMPTLWHTGETCSVQSKHSYSSVICCTGTCAVLWAGWFVGVKILLKAKKRDKHWADSGPLKEQFTISDQPTAGRLGENIWLLN